MEERDVEQGLLGALLKKPDNFGSVSELVNEQAFSWLPYRDLFLAIKQLRAEGLGVDSITCGDTLDKMGKLQDFTLHNVVNSTGRNAIALIRQEGRAENAITYAKIAKNYGLNRTIIEIVSKGAEWATKGRNPAEIVADITNRLSTLDSGHKDDSTITFNEAVSRAWDATEEAGKGNMSFLQTGFIDLDRLMIGLSQPDMTIVAARPGVGKTAFLATVVFNIMRTYQNKTIAFFSLEMGSEQVAMRFISMHSGIPYNSQRTGKFVDDQYSKYVGSVSELTAKNYPLHLNDIPGLKPNKIRQELRRIGKVDLVVLDYLQLAEADDKKEQRHLEVASVSRALKGIAKEFRVPVLVAAQLSRAANQRSEDNKRPVMSDLAESGSLERDADNIIFLHRDFGVENTFVYLAKQRNGPVGEFMLNYDGTKTMFTDRIGNTK